MLLSGEEDQPTVDRMLVDGEDNTDTWSFGAWAGQLASVG